MLDVSSPSSLPLSFLVEILGERDAQFLDDLETLVQRKRRELDQRAIDQRAVERRKLGTKETE
jgi:hypothetical protein